MTNFKNVSGMGEAGDLNKSFIDLDEFNGNWREVYFF